MERSAILPIAVDIARAAGALVREGLHAPLEVTFKGVVDPVTQVDLQAEQLIVRRLRAAFPGHRVYAEETGGDDWRDPGEPIWLIDPLDGTNNFAHGFPHVAVSLGLLVDGALQVGVIVDPLRDETFTALAGGGATLNGRPIRVSQAPRLADALLGTGFPYDRRTVADNNVQRLDHFLRRCQGVRRAGAAVLDLAYVACGRLDGFWELRLNPWDVAAGILIVREAGGQVTDDAGLPDCLSGNFVVASNGRIHDEMLRVVREGARAPHPDLSGTV